MSTLFVVDLESVPSRYTYYWKEHLPKMLKENTSFDVVNVSGNMKSVEATKGAFLNFNLTNIYKSEQVQKIASYFDKGMIKDGDAILFADAWNPAILNIKYMVDLSGLDIKLHGIWHAGSYDKHDFLGRMVKDKSWSYASEKAFFNALDYNYFATNFHIEMFDQEIGIENPNKVVRTGLPMEYISTLLDEYRLSENLVERKEKLVCFPHRIAPEKNPCFFKEVMSYLPDYDYIICQEHNLSKKEYYEVLARSSIVFSANDQETLGIGTFEGMMFGAKPVVPNKLSYKEMYPGIYKYAPEIVNNSPERLAQIIRNVDKCVSVSQCMEDSKDILDCFFSGSKMYEKIEESINDKS